MKPFTVSGLCALFSLAYAQQCPTGSGVGMIVARASTEDPGTGIIGAVADDVASQIPGSTITSVDYPATLQNYQSSEAQGVAAMTQLVQNFTTSCPGAKMVLMGYSQVGAPDDLTGRQLSANMSSPGRASYNGRPLRDK